MFADLSWLERIIFSDGEDTEESLSTSEVVISDSSVVLLSCSVQNVYLYLKHTFYMKNQ